MLGPVVKSFLKETIHSLPENYASKEAGGAIADLAKKGVKPEELEYAALDLPKGPVTKQDLVNAEAKRKDKFTVSENKQYDFVTIDKKGVNNPTYRSKVLQFRQEIPDSPNALTADETAAMQARGLDTSTTADTSVSRYTSEHFTDTPNYLAHTRVYDETIDGTPTRVLTEIQSDLHQQGRQVGYGDTEQVYHAQLDDIVALAADLKVEGLEDAIRGLDIPATVNLLKEANVPEDSINMIADEMLRHGEITSTKGVPKSPYEKTWLRKGIERELVDAVNEGRQQLAIPISGNVKDLSRSEGIQKWYETQVLNTAKKVAKQTNSDFELKAVGGVESVASGSDKLGIISVIIKEGVRRAKEEGHVDIYINSLKELEGMDSDDKQKLISYLNVFRHGDLSLAETKDLHRILNNTDVKSIVEPVTYAVIKPKGPFSTTLYSTPAAGAVAAYSAYQAGKSDEEVIAELKGMGLEVDDMPEVQKQMEFVAEAVKAGNSIEDISEFLKGKEVKADTVTNEPDEQRYPNPTTDFGTVKGSAFTRLTGDEPLKTKDLVSALTTLNPVMTSNTTAITAWFGDKEAHRNYDIARDSAMQKIIDAVHRDFGKTLVWKGGDVGEGSWFEQTEQGLIPVDPTWFDGLKQSSGEAVGGLAGAVAGFNLAPPVPFAKAVGAFAGGVAGAMLGSQVDYLREAIDLHQEMESSSMMYKAFSAAEVSAIAEVGGFFGAGLAKLGWSGIKRAKNLILEGNSEGAYTALKETLFLEEDQLTELVERFKKLNPTVKGTDKQVAIQAVALTEPGVQQLVGAAGGLQATATNAAVTAVNRRAKDVLETTLDLADPDAATKFKEDLANYVSDVKDFYATVKAQAAQQPKGKLIKFDYDKLAIDPLLDSMYKNIEDPATAEKFLRQMQIVRSKSESRTFADMIELRQLVNDFLYNKRITKSADAGKLRTVLNSIDGAIEKSAHVVMENPEEWLGNWREARKQYSNMKKTQSTALYRLMFDKSGKVRPVQPEAVVKGLTKYMTALDGSFEEVMSKLPVQGRAKYEGTVIDTLANKYTLRTIDGSEAIDFVRLADDLKQIGFTTPQARASKASLLELAETFRNDPAIMSMTKTFDKATISQGLTDNIVVKAKFELAANTYQRLRSLLPGKVGREQDLIKQVAKLLDNPLDSKAFKDLSEELSSDVNLSAQIKELQRQEAYARATQVPSGKVRVYKNGKLSGSGDYTTIPMRRIADMDKVKAIADAESISVYSESLEAILKQHGFLGMVSGTDRVKVFK